MNKAIAIAHLSAFCIVVLAITACGFLLTGCEQDPHPGPLRSTVDVQQVPVDNSRVKVQMLDIIHDQTAYGAQRGVYLITDTKTDKEYIGVSGIGISEAGSHWTGKTSTNDER